MDDWWTIFRSGMWRLYYQLSPEGRKRYYDEMIPLLHHTKQEVMGERDDDCYYLVYIGTKPNARGRGYAGRLILEMIVKVRLLPKERQETTGTDQSQADAENRPIYLESSSFKNNAYYAKFGFEAKKDISFKRGQVPVKLYIMVREPRSPKHAYTASIKYGVGDLKA